MAFTWGEIEGDSWSGCAIYPQWDAEIEASQAKRRRVLARSGTRSPRTAGAPCGISASESCVMKVRPLYVGIDLGTTNSTVAVFDGQELTVVRNGQGSILTPSIVRIDGRGNILVGSR